MLLISLCHATGLEGDTGIIVIPRRIEVIRILHIVGIRLMRFLVLRAGYQVGQSEIG